MILPLWLLNPALRLLVKAPLGWIATPQKFRARFERDARMMFRLPAHIRREERMEEGLRLVRVTPPGAVAGRAILYLHGGAYIAGSPETHQHLAAALGEAAGAEAHLPDYRLAPEAPFPAAVDDAFAAWTRLLEDGFAPSQIAIAGDSAGGGLAFALLQRIEAEGTPPPAAVIGYSPWTDMTMAARSLSRNARHDVMLPVKRMDEVVGHYLGGADARDPLASPAFGTYRAAPPALILASDSEILTDDARAMAETLSAAGGDVQIEIWRKLPHAWPIFCGRLAEADEAIRLSARFLRRAFGDEDSTA